jgi:hypothetical protein
MPYFCAAISLTCIRVVITALRKRTAQHKAEQKERRDVRWCRAGTAEEDEVWGDARIIFALIERDGIKQRQRIDTHCLRRFDEAHTIVMGASSTNRMHE